MPRQEENFPNHFLTDLQRAVVDKEVVHLEYFSNNDELTRRDVEPIGLFYYGSAWHLIAWCRLRTGYRDFRADRIKSLTWPKIKFDSRNLISLQEYLLTVVQDNREVEKVAVLFDPAVARHVRQTKYLYGFVSEETIEGKIRMHFLSASLHSICRWLLMYGKYVEIEYPEKARDLLVELVEELSAHHLRQSVI
jgi:predicted DNA-binding transcriptional regulator YafY